MKKRLHRIAALTFILCAGFLSLARPAAAIDIETVKGPKSGVTAWLVEDHTNPIIRLSFAFRGGAALDPVGKEGLATLVAATLDEGAGDLDSQAYQGKLEDLASDVGFRAGLEEFSGFFSTLTPHQDDAFKLLALALAKPRFDDAAVDRMRRQIVSGIRRASENPRAMAPRRLMALMFPDHPYSRDPQGSEQTIPVIKIADMRAFVAERLARDNLVVAAVGDITKDALAKRLDQLFAGLPAHAKSWALPAATPVKADRVEIIERPVPQSVIRWAQPGILRNDPDFFAAYILNHILGGGGFESRLVDEVREKRGLAYSTTSNLSPLKQAGLWMGAADTRNDSAAQSLSVIRDVWKKTAEEGVTDKELDDAKTFIIGSYALQFSSSGGIANVLMGIQLDELGIGYIDNRAGQISAVTAADIKRVAQKLLMPDGLTVVIVGQPKDIAAKP